MKKNNLGTVIFEDFKIYYPWAESHVVKWELFDEMEIIVELDDGTKALYDYSNHSYRHLRPDRLDRSQMDERQWGLEFSLRLAAKMRQHGIDQETLSERTGVSQPTISNYMSGKTIPNFYIATKLAEGIGCSLDDLLHFPK